MPIFKPAKPKKQVEKPYSIDVGGQQAQAAKDVLRKDLLFKRNVISADERSTAGWKVANYLRQLIAVQQPTIVALYQPINGEMDISPLMHDLHAAGIGVALPRVAVVDMPLVFNLWQPDERLDFDKLGIPCARGAEVLPAMVVAPCVGFDRQGYRLGYGKGYYDKTFKHFTQPVMGVGVSFAFAEIPNFPAQYADVRLEYVATELALIRCIKT